MSTALIIKLIIAGTLATGAVTVLVYHERPAAPVIVPYTPHQIEMMESVKTAVVPTTTRMK